MAKVVLAETTEHDPLFCEEAGGANFADVCPACRAVGGCSSRLTGAPYGHAYRNRHRQETTGSRNRTPFLEDLRRVGLVPVPPPKDGRRNVDGEVTESEPGRPKLWLIADKPSTGSQARPP